MNGLELYEKVRAVPDTAKKPIQGGRMNGKTDINPMWRLKVLTEQFGPCGIGWYYVPVRKWLEARGDEVAAFVDIELYVKAGGEWSKPISGTGGSSFATKERSGVYVSDECYKMATTDAISVACKQLGIGADVYWDADRTKYDNGKKDAADKKKMETLLAELKRTGVGKKNICENYRVGDIFCLSAGQVEEAIKILGKKPDKPLDPGKIPPEEEPEGLPWNTPER